MILKLDSTVSSLVLRSARREDAALILQFIKELAEYERLLDLVVADEARIEQMLFGEKPYAEVVLAEWDGEPAGFALFFHNFSTFLAKPGIYLEDLFVRPEFRGRGLGKALLKRLAELAVERGCGRLEWAVLDWNKPSIDFYESLHAKPMSEWIVYRLTGDSLEALASPDS